MKQQFFHVAKLMKQNKLQMRDFATFINRNRDGGNIRLYVQAKNRMVKLSMGTRKGYPRKDVHDKLATLSRELQADGHNVVFLAEGDSVLLQDGAGTVHSPQVEWVGKKYELFARADGFFPIIGLDAAKVAALDAQDFVNAFATFETLLDKEMSLLEIKDLMFVSNWSGSDICISARDADMLNDRNASSSPRNKETGSKPQGAVGSDDLGLPRRDSHAQMSDGREVSVLPNRTRKPYYDMVRLLALAANMTDSKSYLALQQLAYDNDIDCPSDEFFRTHLGIAMNPDR